MTAAKPKSANRNREEEESGSDEAQAKMARKAERAKRRDKKAGWKSILVF